MTMPHLGNCPHKPGTWCLTCVREEWERREAEADDLRSKLAAAEARIGRLQREVMASRELFDDLRSFNDGCGCCGNGRDVGLEEEEDVKLQTARRLCEAHNDLTPPTAEGASDGKV